VSLVWFSIEGDESSLISLFTTAWLYMTGMYGIYARTTSEGWRSMAIQLFTKA